MQWCYLGHHTLGYNWFCSARPSICDHLLSFRAASCSRKEVVQAGSEHKHVGKTGISHVNFACCSSFCLVEYFDEHASKRSGSISMKSLTTLQVSPSSTYTSRGFSAIDERAGTRSGQGVGPHHGRFGSNESANWCTRPQKRWGESGPYSAT